MFGDSQDVEFYSDEGRFTLASAWDPWRKQRRCRSGKAIALPPDHYVEALKRIQVTFLSTPLLTQSDQLAIPLPDEPGYAWSWVEHDGNQ